MVQCMSISNTQVVHTRGFFAGGGGAGGRELFCMNWMCAKHADLGAYPQDFFGKFAALRLGLGDNVV